MKYLQNEEIISYDKICDFKCERHPRNMKEIVMLYAIVQNIWSESFLNIFVQRDEFIIASIMS